MKITHTKIEKLLVEDVEGLDGAINIILDATGLKRGLATVRYNRYEWSSFWNAMPQDSVIEFFAKAPTDYLVDEMAQMPSRIDDHRALKARAITALLKLRRAGELLKPVAAEHYALLGQMSNPHHCDESMSMVFGDEWWHCIETMANPQYELAEKVIGLAQAAVRQAISCGDLRVE
jgi:hypothetical protein